ncbi:peptidoglycan DD-metalloendopeptidase family protein (plasmid) [Alkalihalophilus sp. As8PL]|uniref:Peptidoglycan DD-metalloendopeptidase family protein n=1 Tax=Alkalihalophilus sp. As8PL TaxID=3237103 RepID=A0AB39BN09_9BACI
MSAERKIDINTEESSQHDRYANERSLEDVKREILNLPSSTSYDSSHDSVPDRRDNQSQRLNQLRDIQSSTDSHSKESRGPQRDKSEKAREAMKEKVITEGRKRLAKKAKREAIKRGIKVAAQLLRKAIVSVFMAIMKKVLIVASIIGAKALIIFIAVLLFAVMVMLIFSALFGSSDGVGDEGEIGLFNEYITDLSNATVDSAKAEQQMYRVPEALISATYQIAFWHYDEEGKFDPPPVPDTNDLPKAPRSLSKDFPDETDMLRDFTALLQPIFTYGTFTDVRETQEIICEDGVCSPGPVEKENFEVERLVSVSSWNGFGSMDHEVQTSDWFEESTTHIETRYRTETRMVTKHNPRTGIAYEVEESYKVPYDVTVETINKERYNSHVKTGEDFRHDFRVLDSALTTMGYEKYDKELTEGLYEFTANQPLYYVAWLEGDLSNSITGMLNYRGNVIPGSGIPTEFMPHYLEAQAKYNIPWSVLASIHYEETKFSTHPTMISYVGAVGHMQFMPRTWVGWGFRGDANASVTALGNIIGSFDITNLANIERYGGYGRDGSGNGKANPWDIQDAIHTAAYYLQKHNYNSNPRKAILSYNHSGAYADSIIARANKFESEARYTEGEVPQMTSGTFMRPATGTVTSTYGPRASFGGRMHNGIDIGKNGRTTDVPIVAAADGTVTHANWSDSFGNLVIIQHNVDGKRIDTLYAHMVTGSVRVRVGSKVNKGDIIGLMGNTGRSFGPHLHFEIHVGGYQPGGARAVNPLLYVPK